ncbi:TPA: hypothetical protein ACIB17_003919, partial [Salmonella enterica subsp. enterica serovar Java]
DSEDSQSHNIKYSPVEVHTSGMCLINRPDFNFGLSGGVISVAETGGLYFYLTSETLEYLS